MQARGVPAPPRAPSLQSTAHGGAARLNNRALGLDDPQLHPAPRAYPQGRTNARGIASASAPVVWATAQALGKGIPPSAHGGTVRLNNRDLRRCSGLTTKHPRPPVGPRGNPARAIIERGAASAPTLGIGQPQSKRAPRRIPPAATTVPHQRKAIRQGQPPESIQTQPQATATDPPAYSTQGRAKTYHRQGNPPHTESNGSAVCLNNRATLSAGRVNQGAQQASRKAASDAVTASQAKAAARETSQAKDNRKKAKKPHLRELKAHVGLGQPRTRHHAQSGRSGHPSDTVPLA
ncbi:hypothetical protein WOLCODRAFT_159484 [Wolfiporia cocos MD-104 SS10]|uniref:Uncharacterized protein n=1 Tax=Wolfiporia cocos (strain MD-104) TaxID=742152 RepID=A0A2H3JKJ8_WOLCO|nr:hypothetical protein WOLCODRAFT_159484 [Wolfiporia cocos MD-104 SS10]